MKHAHEVFIDGSNFHATIKALNIRVDYAKLREWLLSRGVTRINYLTAIFEDDDQVKTLQPLVDWLTYNGYNLIHKPAKAKTNSDGVRHIKGNMDVELAVGAMQTAEYCDEITLFTGDGDFVSLIRALQLKGCHVTVISSFQTEPSVIADELRRQADTFIDVNDLRVQIESNQS